MEHGCPQLILSDSGSQLVAAGKLLNDYLNDDACREYLSEYGIEKFEFNHYPKGRNELGGLVESCVKLVKKLLYGSIRNNVLAMEDFEFLVSLIIHLVNRRPIAFKETLRQDPKGFNSLPSPITPEMLVKGHELISMNVFPQLSASEDLSDPTWPEVGSADNIRTGYEQLSKCRQILLGLYHSEFMSNLMQQSTNAKNRYKKIKHDSVKCGDLVLLKEPLTKRTNFPLALVTEIEKNDMGEVTCVHVKKGKTGEIVRRHVHSIIPILASDLENIDPKNKVSPTGEQLSNLGGKARSNSQRAAALRSREQWMARARSGLI